MSWVFVTVPNIKDESIYVALIFLSWVLFRFNRSSIEINYLCQYYIVGAIILKHIILTLFRLT